MDGFRKVLALLVSVAMLTGMASFTAIAEDEPEEAASQTEAVTETESEDEGEDEDLIELEETVELEEIEEESGIEEEIPELPEDFDSSIPASKLSDDDTTITVSNLPKNIESATATVISGDNEVSNEVTVSSKTAKIALSGSLDFACDYAVSLNVVYTDGTEGVIDCGSVYSKCASGYVFMNIPYAQFYTQIASLKNGSSVDVVSSATTGKSGGCKNVWFDANSSSVGGTQINGIVFPVFMTGETWGQVRALGADEHSAYYISGVYEGEECPAVSTTLTYKKSKCTFSAMTYEDPEETEVSATISDNVVWGDYEIDISFSGIAPAEVYGVLVNTADGASYAMKQAENLWTPNAYNKIAFSVGYKCTEPHGGVLTYEHTQDLEGKTITGVTYITTSGVKTYNFSEPLVAAVHFEQSVVATLSDDCMSVELDGLTEAVENPRVTVATSGRGAITLVSNAEIVDGCVALPELPIGTYNVTVTSDNYAAISAGSIGITAVAMNIPYDQFYSEVVGMSNGSSVDVVSSATTGKSGSCKNVWFDADSSSVGGTQIDGIVFPVMVDASTYSQIKASGLEKTDAYYIDLTSLYTEQPSLCTKLTYKNGSYSFSKMETGDSDTSTISATITSNVVWGDYEIELGFDGIAPADVYGVLLNTSDGTSYAMKQSENLWTPGSYKMIAFSVGYKTSEPHGGVLTSEHTKSIEGKTITGVTYLTTSGVKNYTFEQPLPANVHYTGEVSAELTDTLMGVKLTGLPEDIENATVTVTTGGRGAVTVASKAAVVGDTAALSGLPVGNDFTVTVESDNYAAITCTNKVRAYAAVMNIPYDQFYTDVMGMSNGSSVDVVSSATTQKSGSCSNVWYDEGTSVAGGKQINGIMFPVVTADAALYEDIIGSGLNATDAYYATALKSAPAVASKLTSDEEDYTFSKLIATSTESKTISASISSSSVWGDYQITLGEGVTPANVYAVTVNTQEGKRYAMKQAENLWSPRNYSEIAFSVGYTTKEPHGSILTSDHTRTLEGKTITGVTFVTTEGVKEFTFETPLLAAYHYDGEITAVLSDDNTAVTVSGIPYYMRNPVVSVYVQSGRTKTYLAEEAVPEGNTVVLDGIPAANTTYTVVVTSDNYAAISTTFTTGNVLANVDYPDDIAVHVNEVMENVSAAAIPSGVTASFTYASSNEKILVVDPETGSITGKKAGTADITVTATADVDGQTVTKTVTKTVTVTVTKAPTSISVTPKKTTMAVGTSVATAYTITKNTVCNHITYASSNTEVATVDDNGVVTAVAAGTAKITVMTCNNRKATLTVTVKPAPEAVTLSADELNLNLKKSYTLQSVVAPADSYGTVTYTSSDESVVKVTSAGKLTAVGLGTAEITATVGNVSAVCTVNVWNAPKSIKLDTTSVTLPVSEATTMQLTYTLQPADDDTINPEVTWSSSKPAVATVEDGLVTFTGKTGKTVITVKTSNGKTAKCSITVK